VKTPEGAPAERPRRYGLRVIRIEAVPDVKESRCDSCGGTNRLLRGFVYQDDYAHGVYFVEWCDGEHPARDAFMTIGLGPFGEGVRLARPCWFWDRVASKRDDAD
jgi:hypothetical protein